MTNPSHREIPYNYTSADDRQAVSSLLGKGVWKKLEELRERRVTGRSARLLMRVFGEVLVHRRNPYLRQELVTSVQPAQALLRRRRGELQGHPGRRRERHAGARGPGRGPAHARRRPRRGPAHARPARPDPAGPGGRGGARERPARSLHADRPRHRRHRLAPAPPARRGHPHRGVAGGAAPLRHPGSQAPRHPARRGDGAHRRRHPAHARLRDGEHREAEPDPRRLVAPVRPGRRTDGDGAGGGPRGRGHHRGGHGARHPPRPGLRHRPHQRLGLHHRRQHRRERRRQGLRSVGHLHRQPGVVPHRHARRATTGPCTG